MKIGVDFDNTIVCFDQLFYRAAMEKGLVTPGMREVKDSVRNSLRQIGRENDWTEIQGYVYGRLIQEAPAFPGVKEVFVQCRQNSIPIVIISHKTRHPFIGHPYDLHKAAYDWLEHQAFFGEIGLKPSAVFFELTKQQKLDRISREQCTHFIDDLPEFLNEDQFPPQVNRILFDPQLKYPKQGSVQTARSWSEVKELLNLH